MSPQIEIRIFLESLLAHFRTKAVCFAFIFQYCRCSFVTYLHTANRIRINALRFFERMFHMIPITLFHIIPLSFHTGHALGPRGGWTNAPASPTMPGLNRRRISSLCPYSTISLPRNMPMAQANAYSPKGRTGTRRIQARPRGRPRLIAVQRLISIL